MRILNRLSYLFALPFTIASFILMLTSDAIILTYNKTIITFSGTDVVFGWYPNGTTIHYDPSPLAKAAWIIALVAIILMIFGMILRFIYGDELHGFHVFLGIILIAGLIIVGVFLFLAVPTFMEANDYGLFTDRCVIGNMWGLAGAFYFLSSLIIAFPLVFSIAKRR